MSRFLAVATAIVEKFDHGDVAVRVAGNRRHWIIDDLLSERGQIGFCGGLGIGLTLTAAILCIGPASDASLNPARSFGPALVGGAWTMHWAYWVGPIVGAALAAYAYKLVFGEE